jgi:hypothetical protein
MAALAHKRAWLVQKRAERRLEVTGLDARIEAIDRVLGQVRALLEGT